MIKSRMKNNVIYLTYMFSRYPRYVAKHMHTHKRRVSAFIHGFSILILRVRAQMLAIF